MASPIPSRPVLFAAAVLAGAVVVFDVLTPLGIVAGVLYIVPVLLCARAPERRSVAVVLAAFIGTVLTLAGVLISPPGDSTLWVTVANRVIAVTAIWATALLSVQRLRAEEDARRLRELLPICASCKKIRDDKGYWNLLEEYFEEHGQARFTHGLCPECATRLYPELRSHAHLN
ncbi:MAG: hypothetical protein AB1411_07320 [Nitrospirota bacterium]